MTSGEKLDISEVIKLSFLGGGGRKKIFTARENSPAVLSRRARLIYAARNAVSSRFQYPPPPVDDGSRTGAHDAPQSYIYGFISHGTDVSFFSPPSLLLSVKSFTRKRITAGHERTNERTESKSGANQNDISAHTVHLTRGGCSSVVQLGRPINIRGGNFRVSFFFRSRKNRDRKRRFRRGK